MCDVVVHAVVEVRSAFAGGQNFSFVYSHIRKMVTQAVTVAGLTNQRADDVFCDSVSDFIVWPVVTS